MDGVADIGSATPALINKINYDGENRPFALRVMQLLVAPLAILWRSW